MCNHLYVFVSVTAFRVDLPEDATTTWLLIGEPSSQQSTIHSKRYFLGLAYIFIVQQLVCTSNILWDISMHRACWCGLSTSMFGDWCILFSTSTFIWCTVYNYQKFNWIHSSSILAFYDNLARLGLPTYTVVARINPALHECTAWMTFIISWGCGDDSCTL